MKTKKIIATLLCAAVVAVVPMFSACGESYTINVYQSDVSASDIIEALWEKYNEEADEELSYEDFIAMYFSDLSTSNSVGECLLSSMKIYAEFIVQDSSSGQSKYTRSVSTGGAVIYRMDYENTYIVTNYHVIYNSSADSQRNGGYTASAVYGYLYGSEDVPSSAGYDSYGVVYDYGSYGIELEYIGGSVSADIAVLRVDTKDIWAINSSAKAVNYADDYCVGDTAIAIGNPNNGGISVTKGIISMVDEYISLNIDGKKTRSYRSIRIDTALYSGNSGGGLFNSSGELIGIANAGSSTDENINYAVPIEIVTGTADSIIYYATDDDNSTSGAYTVDMGLELTSKNSKYVYSEDGHGAIEEDVVVSSIDSGSIASTCDIQTDDIIKKLVVNGVSYEITRTFNLSDLGLTLRKGDEICFVYERSGVENTTNEYTIAQTDLILLDVLSDEEND